MEWSGVNEKGQAMNGPFPLPPVFFALFFSLLRSSQKAFWPTSRSWRRRILENLSRDIPEAGRKSADESFKRTFSLVEIESQIQDFFFWWGVGGIHRPHDRVRVPFQKAFLARCLRSICVWAASDQISIQPGWSRHRLEALIWSFPIKTPDLKWALDQTILLDPRKKSKYWQRNPSIREPPYEVTPWQHRILDTCLAFNLPKSERLMTVNAKLRPRGPFMIRKWEYYLSEFPPKNRNKLIQHERYKCSWEKSSKKWARCKGTSTIATNTSTNDLRPRFKTERWYEYNGIWRWWHSFMLWV